MKMKTITAAALCAAPVGLVQPALAADKPFGVPVAVSDTLTIDPIIDARLRYEAVDQPTTDADAVTARLRAGFEIKHTPSHLSFLIEGEGTLGIVNDYNAFPFPLPGSPQRRPGFAVVPDGQSIGINRLQLQYKAKALAVTLGRQRINLDDQRFVGSVAWRQNEQTFDALRAEAALGPVQLDATYALRVDTIFGSEAGARSTIDGDFAFLSASAKLGPLTAKAFSYLIDYSEAFAFANSSQTFGARVSGSVPVSPAVKLNVLGSYARQSDLGQNPANYTADFLVAEAGLAYRGFTLTGGYEKLGADAGSGQSFQTPLATLHKFNGWADVFLATPGSGLQDTYVTVAKMFPKVAGVQGVNANVTYHAFRSDIGDAAFGTEWDASLGFKTGKVGWLVKYADYNATGFGVDRRIVWLQSEIAF